MWNDPEVLEMCQTGFQWTAIVLVFIGAAAGIATLVVQSKEQMTSRARDWCSNLQWIAIVLVVLGGLVQVATLIVGKREKELTAVLDRATELQEQSQRGSWSAYQELVRMTKQPGPFQETLNLRLQLIQKEMLAYRDIPGMRSDLNYTVAGKSIPVQSLTATQMFEILSRPSSSVIMRQSLQTYILGKPKQDVLKTCRAVLANSDSLPARAAACGILARLLGTMADFLDCQTWAKISQKEIESSQQPDGAATQESAPSAAP